MVLSWISRAFISHLDIDDSEGAKERFLKELWARELAVNIKNPILIGDRQSRITCDKLTELQEISSAMANIFGPLFMRLIN